MELNEEQRRIVGVLTGAILVLAPVGTGKTRVLAERAVHAVHSGIPAKRILCLTFTNRAARQMSERLARYSPEAAREATIKTFHGLCAHMLRTEARQIGLPRDFVICDDVDSMELIKEVFGMARDRDAKDMLARLSDCKTKAKSGRLALHCPTDTLYEPLGSYGDVERAGRYQSILEQRHALDFADLIYYTRVMLQELKGARRRWGQRFDFVQVDEVQDTHMSEYEVVRCLAQRSGNIAFIGDTDQAIYRWRGSEPDRVIAQFERDFAPNTYSLTVNYRATRMLLGAADSFAGSFADRRTHIVPATSCSQGMPIQLLHAPTERDEAAWIGRQIQSQSLGNPEFAYSRVAVLTRTNRRGSVVSSVLEKSGIPCMTVEQYEFFRRQEIKDALAYLRLLVNPYDASAMQRMMLRPRRGVGERTISRIITEGEPWGLRLTDFASSVALHAGDPFAPLVQAYHAGEIVVVDVETTGLSVGDDEVIEIAAERLVNGNPNDKFHAYVQNTVPVDDSESVHHHSDAFLAQHGQPAAQVLPRFLHFARDAVLVGHNLGFDLKMIGAEGHRLNVTVPQFTWADTFDASKRFIRTGNYRLESLAAELGLDQAPTHRADDDVRTTVLLLRELIPRVAVHSRERRSLVSRYGRAFEALSQQICGWREVMTHLRPAILLQKIMTESGLIDHYSTEPNRLAHLSKLVAAFEERDDARLHPETALRRLIEFTTLAKNVDYLSDEDNEVVIVTIYQAKGLEFDTVFIAGAVQNEIPHFFSIQDGRVEEERHLFYVAMTRAKHRLLISGHSVNDRGYRRLPSSFISDIAERYVVRAKP